MSQVFISCLFDLSRREPGRHRDAAFYLEHGSFVLGLDVPLVVYADPEFVAPISRARAERGLADQTTIVGRALEACPAFKNLEAVRPLATFRNADPGKDTALHQLVNWMKVDFVHDALSQAAPGATHAAWIDFGIAHAADPPVTMPRPSDRLAALEMRAVAPSEIADRLEFYRYERGRIAGGFLRASRGVWRELVSAFRAELSTVLALGTRPNEQQVLSYLRGARPDLFDPYFGDYPDVLRNWDFVRGGLETVMANLRHSEALGLDAHAVRIREAIDRSITSGALDL